MPAIRLTGFQGMIPKVHPTLLPDSFAQVCNNARMRNGALVPFRANEVYDNIEDITDPENNHVLTLFSGAWRAWPQGAKVVPAPIAENRIYISGDGAPRVQVGEDDYPMKLAAPTGAPTVAVTSGTVDPDTAEALVFSYTFVTSLGEESPPAPLSAQIDHSSGVTITVSGFSAAPAGRAITHRRIYRSVTDYAGNAVLHFVAEIPLATTSLAWDDITYPVVEPIATADFDAPPDAIEGFTTMPNGIIAGFVGRELMFCEPYRPHAWPIKYRLSVDYEIMGLAAFGSTLAVLTKGTPYISQGTHPENMVLTKVEQNLPCIAADGIVDMGYAALYPSHTGLVSISAQGAQVVSAQLFDRDGWQALHPSTFRASHYEGRYAFLHNPGDGYRMGLIDVTGESPFYITTDTGGRSLYHHLPTGDLFILANDGLSIRRFDDPAGAPRDFRWRSRRLILPFLTNFGIARIWTDVPDNPVDDAHVPGHVQLDLIAAGTQIGTIQKADSYERLPAGRLDDRFEVEIRGNIPISRVEIAGSVSELMGA